MVNTARVEIWIEAVKHAQYTFNTALMYVVDNPRQGIIDSLAAKRANFNTSRIYPPWMNDDPEEEAAILEFIKNNDRAIQKLESEYRKVILPLGLKKAKNKRANSGDGLNKGNLAQDLFKANDKATSVASILNRTEQSVPSQSGSQKTTKTFEGKNFKINSQGPYVNNSGGSKGTGPPNFPVNSCHCMGIECEKCGKSDINSSVPVSSIALGSAATVVLPVVAVETRPPNARDWFAEKMFSDSEAEVKGRRHDVAEKVGLVWDADVKT